MFYLSLKAKFITEGQEKVIKRLPHLLWADCIYIAEGSLTWQIIVLQHALKANKFTFSLEIRTS